MNHATGVSAGRTHDSEAGRLAALATTRRSLHTVAELLLAGPQFEASRNIELRVVDGGFATTQVPDVRVVGAEIVGRHQVGIDGRSIDELGATLGLQPRDLADVYADGPDRDRRTPLVVDGAAAGEIAEAYGWGDSALRHVGPDRPRVLWPEHFDVAIDLDEVNYGVSPGDSWCPEPYAYVGPWGTMPDDVDAFWNAPFGASRPVRDLGDEGAVLAFFREGRDRAAGLQRSG